MAKKMKMWMSPNMSKLDEDENKFEHKRENDHVIGRRMIRL
jgi:hypothetical protein